MAIFRSDQPGFEEAVKDLQAVLNKHGFDVGPVDGYFGPNTFNQATFATVSYRNGGISEEQIQEIKAAFEPIQSVIQANFQAMEDFMSANADRLEMGVIDLPFHYDAEATKTLELPPVENEESPEVVVEGNDLKFSNTLCDDIKSLQGFLGIPEDQQAPVIGPKTVAGIHEKLEETFGENWYRALQAMKGDTAHSGEEWGRFTDENPEISMLLQQLDDIADPRFQGEQSPSIFDTLVPNGSAPQPSQEDNQLGVIIDCDAQDLSSSCKVMAP